MKKYNSPICEIKIFATSDVITTSSFSLFSVSNKGDLDNDSGVDRVEW